MREAGSSKREAFDGPANEACDVCGSTDIRAFKCKLICQNCGTILKTCSDLAVRSHVFFRE
jgi:hypothetical protein